MQTRSCINCTTWVIYYQKASSRRVQHSLEMHPISQPTSFETPCWLQSQLQKSSHMSIKSNIIQSMCCLLSLPIIASSRKQNIAILTASSSLSNSQLRNKLSNSVHHMPSLSAKCNCLSLCSLWGSASTTPLQLYLKPVTRSKCSHPNDTFFPSNLTNSVFFPAFLGLPQKNIVAHKPIKN